MDVVGKLGKGLQLLGECGHFDISPHVASSATEVVEYRRAREEAVEMLDVFGGEVGIRPIFERIAHIRAVLAEKDVVHRCLDLDVLLADAQIELRALEEKVDVRIPVGGGIVVSEEFHAMVGADGARLAIVGIGGALVVVVGIDHINHSRHGGGGELGGDVVRGESITIR